MGRWGYQGALVVWGLVSTGLAVALLARHELALPAPHAEAPTLKTGIASLVHPGAWSTLHVLYGPCRCSQRIVDHLALRGPRTDIEEQVLLSNDEGGALKRRLVAAGFAVIDTSPEELRDRFAIEAAPMLLVIRPDGRVGYVGGYTRQKQGLQIEDVSIQDELLREERPEELPVAGCGVSDRLRAYLNPGSLL